MFAFDAYFRIQWPSGAFDAFLPVFTMKQDKFLEDFLVQRDDEMQDAKDGNQNTQRHFDLSEHIGFEDEYDSSFVAVVLTFALHKRVSRLQPCIIGACDKVSC